jgi:hypothetical protein
MAGGERPPSRQAILQQIKRLFNEGRLIPRDHLKRRQGSRNVSHAALLHVFETATAIEDPYWDDDYDNWHVVIRGDVLDEDEPVRIALGVDLENEFLYLITCF